METHYRTNCILTKVISKSFNRWGIRVLMDNANETHVDAAPTKWSHWRFALRNGISNTHLKDDYPRRCRRQSLICRKICLFLFQSAALIPDVANSIAIARFM